MSAALAFESSLGPVIGRYVELKESLGRKYAHERRILQSLDRFLVADGADDLSLDVFQRWCHSQDHVKSGVLRDRMRVVRNLCLYRRRSDPSCFVPDPASFPPPNQYIQPYIFSEDEMERLLVATSGLVTNRAYPLRSKAFRMAVVLLYTAGLRRGEFVRLTMGDYDHRTRTVLIRDSKCHKSRLLPLSADAVEVLESYLNARAALVPAASAAEAPLMWNGSPGVRSYTGAGFCHVCRSLFHKAGIRTPDGRLPRVHDIRHTFAVHALVRWYRSGEDIHAKLPLLSAYMGHVSIASTLYYLSFIEPLRAAASERFIARCGALVAPTSNEVPR